ncbi:prepilin peptidase [Aerococcaceae bacterium DSM 111176]|nr:prepilin peptidase [Aerococcaceae bacterium DSM 111176]
MFLVYFLIGSIFASTMMCCFDHRDNIQYFLTGRSKCDTCGAVLSWYNLIPIVSFLVARGKCTYCHQKLSLRYLIVELITGLVSMVFFPQVIVHNPNFLFTLLIIIVMMISDMTDYYVSDILQVLLLISVIYYLFTTNHPYYFVSSIILFITLYLCNILLPHSIGGADLKFVLIIGFLLEPLQLPLYIFIASFAGLVVILVSKSKYISFIPFLGISFLLLYV